MISWPCSAWAHARVVGLAMCVATPAAGCSGRIRGPFARPRPVARGLIILATCREEEAVLTTVGNVGATDSEDEGPSSLKPRRANSGERGLDRSRFAGVGR